MSTDGDRTIELGAGCSKDPNVILGYTPQRQIKDYRLVVGENSRFRTGTVVYAGTRIGKNFSTGHGVIIREENSIGDDVVVASNSVVDYGCVIGDRVKIHCNVYVAQFTTLEDDVSWLLRFRSPTTPTPAALSPDSACAAPPSSAGPEIGVNVTLLPFITVGERSVARAGSVVTKDVPPGVVVIGNPARVVRRIGELTCGGCAAPHG